MNPARHHSNNATPGAPENWDQSEASCTPLPITAVIENGIPVMHSWWVLTEEERLALLGGAPVRLTCVGRSHPAVALIVDA